MKIASHYRHTHKNHCLAAKRYGSILLCDFKRNQKLQKSIHGRVDRASATKTIDLGSIPGQIKQ